MTKEYKTKKKRERQELRLVKGREWLSTYSGTHLVRAYRKQFDLNITSALMDLYKLGAIDEDRYHQLMAAEEKRKIAVQKKKAKKKEKEFYDQFSDSDENFFYIAGFTSGGAPYGVTWEEMDLEPYEYPKDEG